MSCHHCLRWIENLGAWVWADRPRVARAPFVPDCGVTGIVSGGCLAASEEGQGGPGSMRPRCLHRDCRNPLTAARGCKARRSEETTAVVAGPRLHLGCPSRASATQDPSRRPGASQGFAPRFQGQTPSGPKGIQSASAGGTAGRGGWLPRGLLGHGSAAGGWVAVRRWLRPEWTPTARRPCRSRCALSSVAGTPRSERDCAHAPAPAGMCRERRMPGESSAR